MDRYGMLRTSGHAWTVVGGRVMIERRRSGMLEGCGDMSMDEAAGLARFILSMTGPISHEAVAAMEAG